MMGSNNCCRQSFFHMLCFVVACQVLGSRFFCWILDRTGWFCCSIGTLSAPNAMFVVVDVLLLGWCRVYIMPFLD